jgi:hypothetical protein
MRAVISVESFQSGALGDHCASTGVVTKDHVRMTARFLPRWPLFALLAAPWGIPVALLLPLVLGRRVSGRVPLAPGVGRQIRRRRRAAWAATLAVIVIGLLGTARLAPSAPISVTVSWILALTALGVVAIRAALRPAGSILVRLDRSGRFVCLDGVSSAFAFAGAPRAAQPLH